MSTTPAPQVRVRVGAVIAVAVAAGLVAWLVLHGNGSSSGAQTSSAGAEAVTAQQLTQLAAKVQHPIFWLGPKPGFTYELTKLADGRIYVRYLPGGVKAGASAPYLTVATYPFPAAFAAIQKQASRTGAVTTRLAHRGMAVLDAGYPDSTHVAYPQVDYQVEVYDPTPERAFHLVSGLTYLGSLGARPATAMGATAVSLAQLQAHARALGHPIYWAGPQRGRTYELSETSNGNVFVRYLPRGVKPGSSRPYLTVATYPFAAAFAALEQTVKGAAPIKLAHGGIGIVDAADAKSIHIAFPRSDYEIEVFDPSPRAARRLVASGAVAPVP
jgi:hypothetical protein